MDALAVGVRAGRGWRRRRQRGHWFEGRWQGLGTRAHHELHAASRSAPTAHLPSRSRRVRAGRGWRRRRRRGQWLEGRWQGLGTRAHELHSPWALCHRAPLPAPLSTPRPVLPPVLPPPPLCSSPRRRRPRASCTVSHRATACDHPRLCPTLRRSVLWVAWEAWAAWAVSAAT